MFNEIWKDVRNYEGIYQVSNMGRIRSLDRYIPNTNGIGVRKIRGVMMKTTKNNSGYLCVSLHKKGHTKTCTIHRLVALAFIPNKSNYSDVNHKDEDKGHNWADNLEWAKHKENMNYGNRNKKAGNKLKGTRTLSSNGKASKVICLKTNKIFDCILEAAKFYNCNVSGISQCCRGKSKSCGGYKWAYCDVI